MSHIRELARRRLVERILEQLRGGITPDKIAIAAAIGCSLGLFPILGATTLLCAAAAIALGLNQPIIQMTNYLVYPLQLALLLGFYRAGEFIFGEPHLPLTIGFLMQRFKTEPLRFIADYGMLAVRGIAIWAVIAPVVFLVVLLIVRAPLRALAVRYAAARAAGGRA